LRWAQPPANAALNPLINQNQKVAGGEVMEVEKKIKWLWVAVITQTVIIAIMASFLHANAVKIDLLRENRELYQSYFTAEHELCRVKLRLGDAYRYTLAHLMGRLGLIDHPDSAAEAVLQAYHEMLPLSKEQGGFGIPEDWPGPTTINAGIGGE
jgi:hypothetical protein